jgi:hypothetical protein
MSLSDLKTDLINSPNVKTVLQDLSKNSKMNYLSSLKQFLRFLNSKEDLHVEIRIDEVVKEARTDI